MLCATQNTHPLFVFGAFAHYYSALQLILHSCLQLNWFEQCGTFYIVYGERHIIYGTYGAVIRLEYYTVNTVL